MDKSDQAKPQSEKFRDLARELGCDEDEAKFDEALKRIANAPKPKPEPETKPDEG